MTALRETGLRAFTPARVALGRAGNSLPTQALLDFQLAHARARDAVHFPLDAASLAREFEALELPVVLLKTAARDRAEYLRRPDLGRRLDERSTRELAIVSGPFDIVFVVADGLSALAVHRNAVAVLQSTAQKLREKQGAICIAPIAIVENGRVAVADEIGAAFGASLSVILIGERPGLSSADSLGVYLTWSPRPGRTDAERNCISNIRAEGLQPEAAAERLFQLIETSTARRLSGVELTSGRALAD